MEKVFVDMAYSAGNIPADHTEFGGGPGLIDPQRRKDRVLEPHEEIWEIKATNPSVADEDLAEVPIPRVLKGGS